MHFVSHRLTRNQQKYRLLLLFGLRCKKTTPISLCHKVNGHWIYSQNSRFICLDSCLFEFSEKMRRFCSFCRLGQDPQYNVAAIYIPVYVWTDVKSNFCCWPLNTNGSFNLDRPSAFVLNLCQQNGPIWIRNFNLFSRYRLWVGCAAGTLQTKLKQ